MLGLDENRRPHVCKTCSSSFGRADALLRHERKCTEPSTRQLEDQENLHPDCNEYEAAEDGSRQSPVSEDFAMADSITTWANPDWLGRLIREERLLTCDATAYPLPLIFWMLSRSNWSRRDPEASNGQD